MNGFTPILAYVFIGASFFGALLIIEPEVDNRIWKTLFLGVFWPFLISISLCIKISKWLLDN